MGAGSTNGFAAEPALGATQTGAALAEQKARSAGSHHRGHHEKMGGTADTPASSPSAGGLLSSDMLRTIQTIA
ncbi:MAG: hypothetical protein M3Y41_18685 [Pseudomonadota bacterium]|nr:hypothetical protein [Pseudomonadota bacterium]